MSQSKKHSLIESLINVVIGYVVAVGSQIIIFPWFGVDIPVIANIEIGFIFTFISIARMYVLRRLFNHFTHRG